MRLLQACCLPVEEDCRRPVVEGSVDAQSWRAMSTPVEEDKNAHSRTSDISPHLHSPASRKTTAQASTPLNTVGPQHRCTYMNIPGQIAPDFPARSLGASGGAHTASGGTESNDTHSRSVSHGRCTMLSLSATEQRRRVGTNVAECTTCKQSSADARLRKEGR